MTTVVAGYDTCPDYAPVFGYIGAGSCMILANFGSAWGTWRAGLGICAMGINNPKGVIKNIVPVVMAGVLGIYGLIVAVILTQSITAPMADGTTQYSLYNGYAHLAAGLCCGLSCLASGGTIGMIGETGVKSYGLKATGGKRAWVEDTGNSSSSGDAGFSSSNNTEAQNAEGANRLFVGLLIMLIFSEALALYGLIVALILTQHSYTCTGTE